MTASSPGIGPWVCYDDLLDGILPATWRQFRRRNVHGEYVEYAEPTAVIAATADALEVTINPFTRSNDEEQGLDNAKHVYRSTATFDLGGQAEFAVQMGGRRLGPHVHEDFQSGFAFVGLGDYESGFVYDIFTNGNRVWAMCERLRVGEPFTWVVEAPMLNLGTKPGELQECVMAVDRDRRRVSYFIDGQSVFAAGDLPEMPRQLQFTFGLQTFTPLRGGGSTSLHGQGMTGRWRDFRYRGARIRPRPRSSDAAGVS
jgi:Family of unknown function (DUF6081)